MAIQKPVTTNAEYVIAPTTFCFELINHPYLSHDVGANYGHTSRISQLPLPFFRGKVVLSSAKDVL
jgi:hypothetical protein